MDPGAPAEIPRESCPKSLTPCGNPHSLGNAELPWDPSLPSFLWEFFPSLPMAISHSLGNPSLNPFLCESFIPFLREFFPPLGILLFLWESSLGNPSFPLGILPQIPQSLPFQILHSLPFFGNLSLPLEFFLSQIPHSLENPSLNLFPSHGNPSFLREFFPKSFSMGILHSLGNFSLNPSPWESPSGILSCAVADSTGNVGILPGLPWNSWGFFWDLSSEFQVFQAGFFWDFALLGSGVC